MSLRFVRSGGGVCVCVSVRVEGRERCVCVCVCVCVLGDGGYWEDLCVGLSSHRCALLAA